jgi:hypothetical protein
MPFRILALMHVSLRSTIGEVNESMGHSAVHATRIDNSSLTTVLIMGDSELLTRGLCAILLVQSWK